MKTEEVTRQEALDRGYAAFNDGTHLLVDLPDSSATISVKTPDGKLITFNFCKRHAGLGHQCVDVVNHSMPKDAYGYPLQRALFLSRGTTPQRCHPADENPTTIVVLLIPEEIEDEDPA